MERSIIAVGTILVAGLLYVSIEEANEWKRFKEEHHCKIVAYISPDTSVGVGPSSSGGVAVVVVPQYGKTGWLCDDGITYYR